MYNLILYFYRMEKIFSDEYFMQKAYQEAELAFEKGEIPVGAVVVVNDRIIAKSHNLTQALNDVTAHAEMQAITASSNFLGGKYLINCTIYVTLEPCVMCAGALYWSQISKVVIGALDLKKGFLNAGIKLHPKTEIVTHVLENKCSQILKEFFLNKRKFV